MGPGQILKVLVGSRAHGLADAESDADYRGVFVVPTTALLSILSEKPKQTSWVEGAREDDTSWEIGHFLSMAIRSNPSVLEALRAPVIEDTADGRTMRALFPAIWSPRLVRDAFINYGINQRTKFLADKDQKAAKFACSWLRVLYQAHVLLVTGDLPIVMVGTPVEKTLRAWRTGVFRRGEVIDLCTEWADRVDAAFVKCTHKPDHDAVDAFLLDVRRRTL